MPRESVDEEEEKRWGESFNFEEISKPQQQDRLIKRGHKLFSISFERKPPKFKDVLNYI